MGIRHGFGLWLQPITQAHAWTRETFAFAIAIQNLAWGVTGVFAGMLADRYGAFRVILMGTLAYSLGLVGMAYANTPLTFALSTGLLIGMAQSGTTYAVVYGVIGRNVPADKRSWAMGMTAAAGSFGQFLMVPTEGFLISQFGWQQLRVEGSDNDFLFILVHLERPDRRASLGNYLRPYLQHQPCQRQHEQRSRDKNRRGHPEQGLDGRFLKPDKP